MPLLYTDMAASVKPATKFVTTDRLHALRFQLMAGELAQQIGARIRQRREELGLKQGELAARFDSDAINNQRISDWERGVHRPSDRYMEQLAVALEKDVSWFYSGDAVGQTPDLMGSLAINDATQLDRIEAKLDELLSRTAGPGLAEVLEEEALRLAEQRATTVAESKRNPQRRKAS